MTRFAAGLAMVMMASAAPAAAADREHEQLMADIRMLQAQTMRLQLALHGIVEQIEALVDTQAAFDVAMRGAFANQGLTLDHLGTAVRVVREKLDENSVRISSLSQEVEALRVATPFGPAGMTAIGADPETGLPLPAAAPAAAGAPPAAPAVPSAAAGSPQRLYQTAWADYTNGQWALAVQGFEAYVTAFPRSEFTDDAAFYIGETYFFESRFQEAVAAYEQVILNYPGGDILPEASYKRGLALDRLAEPDLAREAFEQVVATWPDSRMASLAQQQLDRLSQP